MAAYLCLFFIFGTVILCEGKLEKRQVETVCSEDTFTCTNGLCIDSSLACDGRKDCTDGSDETQNLCASFTCPHYAFQCQYGACVAKIAKCNGKVDCADGSDEKLTECLKGSSTVHPKLNCQPDEFRCKSGQCIDDESTCDGIRDCKDGTDETLVLCRSVLCPKYSFRCKYGACVSKSSRCDGIKQCIDGSDENHECIKPTSTPKPKPKPKPITHPQHPTTTNSNSEKSCVVPTVEGSIYSYNDSNKNHILSSGTHVVRYRIVEENCEKDYYKASSSRYLICTENGQWEPAISDKLCLKKCPPMTSDSLDIICTLYGENVDCSKPSIPGTKLKPKCKVTHSLPNNLPETPIELHCLPDGKWSGGLFTCNPYCGRVTKKVEELISNGSKAKYGTAPWNVGIYRMKNNVYDQICGGTLIAPNLVVSAAHCFWHEDLTERVIMNDGTYKIAVGKYARNFSVIDNEFTQIIDVSLIYLKDDYFGKSGFHAGDIAIILLPTKVKISTVVAPACVDWSNSYTVPSGSLGQIVGWGKTEKMVSSSFLMEASLPYINQTTCRKMYTNGFEFFVTPDKFCAGSKSGQGVLEGDSGGGLTFVHNNLHYLTGVVSVKDPNTNIAVAVFTGVGHHIQWVTDIYTNSMYAHDSKISKRAAKLFRKNK